MTQVQINVQMAINIPNGSQVSLALLIERFTVLKEAIFWQNLNAATVNAHAPADGDVGITIIQVNLHGQSEKQARTIQSSELASIFSGYQRMGSTVSGSLEVSTKGAVPANTNVSFTNFEAVMLMLTQIFSITSPLLRIAEEDDNDYSSPKGSPINRPTNPKPMYQAQLQQAPSLNQIVPNSSVASEVYPDPKKRSRFGA